MRIEEVDRNFRLQNSVPEDVVFYDVREEPFTLEGLTPNGEGSFCRLPLSLLPKLSEGMQMLAWHLAGGVVRFATDAQELFLNWVLKDPTVMPHFTACGQSGMELFSVGEDGRAEWVRTVIPQTDNGKGVLLHQMTRVPLPGELRSYMLYLPLYNGLEKLEIGVGHGAGILGDQTRRRYLHPIVFYGSSITQGGCAAKAGSAYSAVMCRTLNAPCVNLGFSGNARGEKEMAEFVAGLSMSAMILDYDHNARSVRELQDTHEAFFRTVRKAHPDLPVLVVSRPDPHPCEEDRQRLEIIRTTVRHALEAGDRRVRFVDGGRLLEGPERDMCLVDGTHPTSMGFYRMARVLLSELAELGVGPSA